MRILHITPELPYEPGGGGGRGREFFLCRRLVERGHQVLNVSPALPAELHRAQSLRDAGVANWVAPRPASPIQEVVRALSAEPRVLANAVTLPVRALEMSVFETRLRPLLHRAADEWRPDAVVVGHDMAAGWTDALPPELPAVLTCHNLTWHWYVSRARRASGAPARVLWLEADRYRRFLLRRLPRFASAVAVSTLEADELRRIGLTRRVDLIPSGVDTQELQPAPEQAGPPRLVFTGTLSYPPNSQGICWFADRVWPHVRRAIGDAQLDVVGKDPPEPVRALHDRDGINVVGPVPVMDPYFARAHAVVVPILTGAGIRMKIVEAMAAGRAIVSTSLGWEGLPGLEPGRHLLVADVPEDFARAAVRLLREPVLRARISRDARTLAERAYDWRGLGDAQEALLAEVVQFARPTHRSSAASRSSSP